MHHRAIDGKQLSRHAGKQARRHAGRHASKQTGTHAGRQTGMQACKQADMRAGKHRRVPHRVRPRLARHRRVRRGPQIDLTLGEAFFPTLHLFNVVLARPRSVHLAAWRRRREGHN